MSDLITEFLPRDPAKKSLSDSFLALKTVT
jgi:hypothetical protein